jgi:hypothetical protein
VQFHQPLGHHHQVGHHVVAAHKLAHRLDQRGHVVRRVELDILVRLNGSLVPRPRIGKRLDLGGAFVAALLLEQHVVVAVAVERRIEVDEVDRIAGDLVAQDMQVIAVIQRVHRRAPWVHGWSVQ